MDFRSVVEIKGRNVEDLSVRFIGHAIASDEFITLLRRKFVCRDKVYIQELITEISMNSSRILGDCEIKKFVIDEDRSTPNLPNGTYEFCIGVSIIEKESILGEKYVIYTPWNFRGGFEFERDEDCLFAKTDDERFLWGRI